MTKSTIYRKLSNILDSGKKLDRISFMEEYDIAPKTFRRYIINYWCDLSNNEEFDKTLLQYDVNTYQVIKNGKFFSNETIFFEELNEEQLNKYELKLK